MCSPNKGMQYDAGPCGVLCYAALPALVDAGLSILVFHCVVTLVNAIYNVCSKLIRQI